MAGPRGEGKMPFHLLWKLFYRTEDCHTVIIHQSMSHNSDQVLALASGLHSAAPRSSPVSYTVVYITNTKAGLYLEVYLWRTRVLQVMIQSVLLLFGLLTLLYILSCENQSSDFI